MKQAIEAALQIACLIIAAVFGFSAILIMAALEFALPVAAIIAILYAVKHFFF